MGLRYHGQFATRWRVNGFGADPRRRQSRKSVAGKRISSHSPVRVLGCGRAMECSSDEPAFHTDGAGLSNFVCRDGYVRYHHCSYAVAHSDKFRKAEERYQCLWLEVYKPSSALRVCWLSCPNLYSRNGERL